MNAPVALILIPEVEDIMELKVAPQRLLVKPHKVTALKTKGGLYIGESADSTDTEQIRNNLLNVGTVISIGNKVTEYQPGTIVYYYMSASRGMIRQDDDLYLMFDEYSIDASITPKQ